MYHRIRCDLRPCPPHMSLPTFVLLAGALLVSGCGDGSSHDEAAEVPEHQAQARGPAPRESAAREGIDACSLITKAEAEEILGVALLDPSPMAYNPVSNSSGCEFDAADSESGLSNAGSLTIRIEEPANPQGNFSHLREQLAPDAEDQGVGDDSFYALSQLFVLDGSHQITVAVALFGSRGEERVEVAKKVAETVLSRL